MLRDLQDHRSIEPSHQASQSTRRDERRRRVEAQVCPGRQDRSGGSEGRTKRRGLELDLEARPGGGREPSVRGHAIGEARERLVADDGAAVEVDDRLEERPERGSVDDRTDHQPGFGVATTTLELGHELGTEDRGKRGERRHMLDQ